MPGADAIKPVSAPVGCGCAECGTAAVRLAGSSEGCGKWLDARNLYGTWGFEKLACPMLLTLRRFNDDPAGNSTDNGVHSQVRGICAMGMRRRFLLLAFIQGVDHEQQD
jgi:hypothetical protein